MKLNKGDIVAHKNPHSMVGCEMAGKVWTVLRGGDLPLLSDGKKQIGHAPARFLVIKVRAKTIPPPRIDEVVILGGKWI